MTSVATLIKENITFFENIFIILFNILFFSSQNLEDKANELFAVIREVEVTARNMSRHVKFYL